VTGREATGRQLTYALLDIERRRKAEARTLEAQASLQRIIEAAPMAITLRDAHSLKIIQVNEVAARGIGRPAHELIGMTPEQVFAPAIAVERRRDMEQALAGAKLTQIEYRVDTGGETRVWDARYLPLAAPGQPPDQCCWSRPTSPSSVPRSRPSSRRRWRSARCWSRKCTTASRTTCRALPAAAADRAAQARVASAIQEVVGQCRRSPRCTACRSA